MPEIKTVSEIIEQTIPTYLKKKEPESIHSIVYDSSTETLEPVYFFMLDLMNDFGLNPKKLVDNFSSSPGSGHFAELGQRASIMQQQGTKLLGDINVVLRSVLNIVYDLKEFRIRLQSYDDLKDNNKKDSAILSLKQIWMDKVDINKGNSSIKAMALGQAGFVTLLDAFLSAKSTLDVEKLDLNEKVKRILSPRIHEFYIWLEQSEKELKKRYELEKAYLKSQVNSLKLYSRWAKPYLKAAQQLEQKEQFDNPGLVKFFNTVLLELSLLGKSKVKLEKHFEKLKVRRNYYSCVLVDFKFRGIPQKVSQQSHYAFGGRAEITFSSYALNADELVKLEKEFEKSDLQDVLKLIEGTTTESLEQLQKEIDFFLEDKSEPEKKKEKALDDSNPFKALIGGYDKPEKSETKPKTEEKDKPLIQDNWIEKTHLRTLAIKNATEMCFALFDVYKKAHGMASYT